MAKIEEKKAKNRDFSSSFYDEIDRIKQKFLLTDKEILEMVSEREEIKIPLCILHNQNLSSLESVVKYLRENKKFNFREIGDLLNRSKYTISATYRKSQDKFPKPLEIEYSEFDIPVEIIAGRKLSVLESIVHYLKDKFELKLSKIAELLNLDQRTIWTVYSRARKKTESNEKQE